MDRMDLMAWDNLNCPKHQRPNPRSAPITAALRFNLGCPRQGQRFAFRVRPGHAVQPVQVTARRAPRANSV